MIHIDVLDHGFVELEDHMGGDAAVVRAARICYDSESSGEDAKLIQRLVLGDPAHNTVFEHAVFRFYVKCPLYITAQWMRHRIGTFNQRSLRYCAAEREYYIPKDEPMLDLYRRYMEREFDAYEDLVRGGWAKERARGVIGTAVYTEFIWTVNAWSLMNWLTKRLDKAAQWEHRQYAQAVLVLFRQAMPITAEAFGPNIR